MSDLAVFGGDIYVTGCFSHVNGTPDSPGAIPAHSLARWTGTEREALDDGTAGVGTPWFEQSACGDEGPDAIWDAPYQRFIGDGTRLFLAGSLSGVGTVASQSNAGPVRAPSRLVRYQDGWATLGDKLWFGGSIAEVGSGAGVLPSVGIARYAWP